MIAVALSVYIIGLLILYTWGTLNQGWYEYYYLWDKGKDTLLVMAMYCLAENRLKWAIKPVIIFSIVRFLWQVTSSITSWDINNIKVVDYLFILLALICSYLSLKELYKWHKSNGRYG